MDGLRMRILPDPIYDAMIAAADAAGSSVIQARVSYVRAHLLPGTLPSRAIRVGTEPALLRCDPPPCIRLQVVADGDLSSDWEVA
jgi:hypothetical protein